MEAAPELVQILASQVVQQGLGGVLPHGQSRSLMLKGLAGHHTVFPVRWT